MTPTFSPPALAPADSLSTESAPPASALASPAALLAIGCSVLLCLAFHLFYWGHTVVMHEADPRLLAQFNGHRPYQLRVLVPFLVHWSARWSGLEVPLCYQILSLGLCFAIFAIFEAYLRVWCAPRASRWLGLALAIPLFAFFSHKWFYPYDVPAVGFNTLALLLLARRRFGLYLLIFTLATFNRETSAFLVLVWVLAARHEVPRRTFWTFLALQIAIWLAIRAALGHFFAANAGQSFEWQWQTNWTDLLAYPRYVDLGLGAATLVLIGLAVSGAATRGFQPPFLQRTRGVFWPFMAVMSLVGSLVETRIYAELIPFLLSPTLVGIWNWKQARLIASPE